ncbi:competence protein ComEA [Nocardioides sp. YR527]|uniref:helix-hairpin-helix domain-containing protein n=1 Tax=Nocardioides sp. YR527 TaxID=1881028 RepID=UPI000882BA28|nr:helix-hairpin-helix domain-containing protein [Nocardioides sp. YR527]SDK70267.1 competence protein ComEA [Nocardioides sp. YR527]
MRTRPTSDHADAVARRLEQLRAEIDPPGEEDEGEEDWQPPWWDGPRATDTAELDPLVPVPGRHASRRQVVISPDAVLPEPLRGKVSLGPWHLVVVTLVLVVGLAVACWWMIRADPEVVPAARASPSASPLVALPTGSAAPGSVGAAPSGGASAGTVTVDVEGKVPKPGIVVLPVGSRVVDAVEAAGGASHKQLAGLNLAAVLSDGQHIVVGAPNGGGVAVPGSGAPAAGAPGAGVSLNTASMEELETLPGVGPVTAQAIIDWRTTNGAFTSVDELLEVDGIGPKTYDTLAPLVTL